MAVGDALTDRRTAPERGQAAIEFVFALLFILIITAALFQVLFFELDVFNQSAVARYEFIKDAHDRPDTTPCRAYNRQFQGRTIGQFAPWAVPYQTVNRNLRYGPKRIHGERGSKYFDDLTYGGFGAHGYGWILILGIDHTQDFSGYIDDTLALALTGLSARLLTIGC
jgi:hypothetical protein